MAKSSTKARASSTEDFPLWKHKGSGQWCKKIRGTAHYFGSWRTDPEGVEALKVYAHELPHLLRGESPPPMLRDDGDGFTVQCLCNQFMESKASAVDDGDLSRRTLADYHHVVKTIASHFGKTRLVETLTPSDFRDFRSDLAKRLNVNTLKSFIGKCRVVFNWALENELVEKLNFGTEFKRPSKKRQQRHRNDRGPKLFHREEIRRMLSESNVHLSAMIHLGINCGFGNTDVATLPVAAVDLENGWVDFPRPKTEVPRVIPLWPETEYALRESLSCRPNPKRRECRAVLSDEGRATLRPDD